jgi:hypothetical protein
MNYTDLGVVSDLHKDARGFRPSQEWMREFASKDYLEQKDIIDNLAEEVEESINEDRQREARAEQEFNRVFNKIAQDFNTDFATAVRWDMDASDVDRTCLQDVQHYFWLQGLSFQKIDELAPQFVQREEA